MPLNFNNFLEKGKNVPISIDYFGKTISGGLYLSAWSESSAAFAVTYNKFYHGYLIYRGGIWEAEKITDLGLVEVLGRLVEEFYQ